MSEESLPRSRARGRVLSQSKATRRPGAEEYDAQFTASSYSCMEMPSRSLGSSVLTSVDTYPVDTSLPDRMSSVTLYSGDVGACGGGGGRGAWRGRGIESASVICRPAHVKGKRGTSGEAINLVANFFAVTSKPERSMYHYHVDFYPEVESIGTRRSMMKDHTNVLGHPYLFDGMALFTTQRLERKEMDLFSERKSDNTKVRIHLKLTRELCPTDPGVLQICNIQMRQNMRHLDFTLMGRHYFDIHDSVEVKNQNLELWPGFMTSIHVHETGLLMRAEVAFKVLRVDTVYDQLLAIYKRSTSYKDVCSKELIGRIVLTRYNNKTYRIDDIDWNASPKDSFPMKDGSSTDYEDYYKMHWGITIKDVNQPLLISLPKKKDTERGIKNFMLVPELCIMTGLSDETRTNFTIMKQIADHTRKDPNQRAEMLRKFLKRIQSHSAVQNDMRSWGLAMSDDLVKIQGRRLGTEEILMANGRELRYNALTADWSTEMKGCRLFQAMELGNWLFICSDRDSGVSKEFLDSLKRVGPPLGIVVNDPEVVVLSSDRTNDFITALQKNVKKGVQLALCVVPSTNKDRYDAIKKTCCIEKPVPSQVVVARTLTKRNMLMSVCTKIAVQLNCKLGGSAWAVKMPVKKAMVIGYDSYHDSSRRGLSVGGLCCSMDQHLTKYYSRVTFQTSHQEMLNGFQTNLTAAIRRYHDLNGGLPDPVFVFRNGVGEGQLEQVLKFELSQVLKCFRDLGYPEPRLAFIVVTKGINTRIMAPQGNTLRNPQPGTVVDSVITRPEWYDFFLVSQSVRQGTVAPTQYNVIYDSTKLRPDHIQRLSYKLTHLYYNWSGTIRVPAPCMYAQKLAFLTDQSLHRAPSLELCDTLFFL